MIDYDVDGTDSDNTLDGFLRDRNERKGIRTPTWKIKKGKSEAGNTQDMSTGSHLKFRGQTMM